MRVEFIEAGDADDAGPNVTLTVRVSGAAGRVVSIPSGIDCFVECTVDFPSNASVRLIPVTQLTTGAAARFVRWQGDDADSDVACAAAAVPLDRSRVCTAVFANEALVALTTQVVLNVAVSGNGSVGSVPDGIACPGDCTESFPLRSGVLLPSSVTLTTTPAPGYRFDGWSGNADCSDGRVTMQAGRNCTALFVNNTPAVTPLDLSATASAGSVQLQWARNSGVESYELTRTPGNDGAASRLVTFAGPADSYLDTAVSGDTRYRYELVARNAVGVSPAATAFATTLVSPNWTRIGASDIDARSGFAQPALALSADGDTVAVAQVFPSGGLDQTQVFVNDAFSPNNAWTRLAGTPGGALTPAAAGGQPALAFDRQGMAYVAWTQTTAGGSDVRVARYDTAAAQWLLIGDALDADLGSAALNDAIQPELVLDANDRPVVAWLQGGGVYVKRWNGSAWVFIGGNASVNVNAMKLMLDDGGTAHLLLRRGSGSAAQLFAYRESLGSWAALGSALNTPLGGFRDSLPFFDLAIDSDGSPLAVWSEGSLAHTVVARRWRNGSWQALPNVVDAEGSYAITGLAVTRSVQAPAVTPTPPVVMLTRQPIFAGANPRNANGDVYLLQNDAWTQRPSLVTFGPMFALTLRVTRQATPIAAWLAETGAQGSGEWRLFVWRGL